MLANLAILADVIRVLRTKLRVDQNHVRTIMMMLVRMMMLILKVVDDDSDDGVLDSRRQPNIVSMDSPAACSKFFLQIFEQIYLGFVFYISVKVSS